MHPFHPFRKTVYICTLYITYICTYESSAVWSSIWCHSVCRLPRRPASVEHLLVLTMCAWPVTRWCDLCCHGNAACTICLLSAAGETRGQSVVCSVQLRQCWVSYNAGYRPSHRPREQVCHTKCLFHVDDSRVSAEVSKFVDWIISTCEFF